MVLLAIRHCTHTENAAAAGFTPGRRVAGDGAAATSTDQRRKCRRLKHRCATVELPETVLSVTVNEPAAHNAASLGGAARCGVARDGATRDCQRTS